MGNSIHNLQVEDIYSTHKSSKGHKPSSDISKIDFDNSIFNLIQNQFESQFSTFLDGDFEYEVLSAEGNEALGASTASRNAAGSNGTNLDGKIDASSQSRKTGDCWLLTGLNSLSYSKAGQDAIKDAMTFNDDGSVSINFKGVGVSYTISAEQLAAANKNSKYSSGDDDVLAFELAVEQLRNDIDEGKIQFAINSPYYVMDSANGKNGNSSIDGGFTEQMWYLLTGKLAETTSDPSKVQDYLNKFQQNPDSSVMSCSFKGGQGDRNGFTVKDANGNPVNLYYSHAYAVKGVDGNKVTIVNPWDSGKEIVLDRNTFAQFANLSYSDLSNKSKDMSGAFSKITGAISGVVKNIGNAVKNIGKSISGMFDKVYTTDSIAVENNHGKYKILSGSALSGVSPFVSLMVEKYKDGEISINELTQFIKSANVDTEQVEKEIDGHINL